MSKPGLAARKCATTILTRVIDDGRGLDGLLDSRHGPASYGQLIDADKALVRAIATTSFRHRGEIEFAFSKLLDRKLPKNARHLIHTLFAAAAQILFMEVPDSAAVDLAVTALKEDKRSSRFSGLANAVLRRLSREKEDIFSILSAQEIAVLNMPAWFRKRTKKSFGRERLNQIALQHMQEPVVDITVKSNPRHWAKELGGVHLFGNSIRVDRNEKIEDWPAYSDGEWWVQDSAASLPAFLLGELAGKSALDLCAAPGGKTAQLAAMGADVTALEASLPRLSRLEENLERLKLKANCVHADLLEWEFKTLFDAVLLDAPCSSTGTIRRHPDVQWTKSPQLIDELADVQKTMIIHSARFLKPGGILVFANCSLDRAEGEDVFAQVVKSCPELKADTIDSKEVFGMKDIITGQGTVRTLPCHLQTISNQEHPKCGSQDILNPGRLTGMDGFFAARFIKAS